MLQLRLAQILLLRYKLTMRFIQLFGIALIGALVGALALTSCSTAKQAVLPNHYLVIMTQTSKNLNTDENGRPSPLLVYFIQLKDAEAFRTADFFALYDNPKQALGADYISLSKLNLTPSTTGRVTIQLNPGVKYVGVVAAFSNQQEAIWRLDLPITSDWGREKLRVRFNKDTVQQYTALQDGNLDIDKPKVNLKIPKGSRGPDINYEVLSYIGSNDDDQ
jgi:type VI secretion system protein VasD